MSPAFRLLALLCSTRKKPTWRPLKLTLLYQSTPELAPCPENPALAYLFSEASRLDNLKRKEREDIRVSKSKMVSEPAPKAMYKYAASSI